MTRYASKEDHRELAFIDDGPHERLNQPFVDGRGLARRPVLAQDLTVVTTQANGVAGTGADNGLDDELLAPEVVEERRQLLRADARAPRGRRHRHTLRLEVAEVALVKVPAHELDRVLETPGLARDRVER